VLTAGAQEFVNLTAEQVRIGTSLPVYQQEFPLGTTYADSTYTVTIEYPEFIDMEDADVAAYKELCSTLPPELPEVNLFVGVSRKKGTLHARLTPLVYRDGKYQKLVSFRLVKHACAVQKSRRKQATATYAEHSVLAEGQWAKIAVPSTGIYQITEALVRQCGFSDISKVKIYGYGGALQPEVLTQSYLSETDDLKEVPVCTVGGRRLFHATGPVTWTSSTTTQRTRNPYSQYGYYFLTQSDSEPLTVDSAAFAAAFYPGSDDYHSLYESDGYAWYHSGRNLYDATPIGTEKASTYQLAGHGSSARLTVVMTYDRPGKVEVNVNDSLVGTLDIKDKTGENESARTLTTTYNLKNLRSENTVQLKHTAGDGTMRLDYLALTMPTARPLPSLTSGSFSSPQFVYRITNQDLHADGPADMVIVIPTSQKLLSQAQRLKQHHEERDSLRVRIVPADELFNEFSSGTPDANAYRRYLKMLYDRAESDADMPCYLLLFGDGTWDNRMLSVNWQRFSPDDFLLCYESENSFSATDSYVSDDYFCMLDDGEGASLARMDMTDVGVGRLTARTEAEAKIMVDKIVDYATNSHAGDWQNTICFMGDDGNNNIHMREAEAAATQTASLHPHFNIKRIYWDAYQRTVSSTGNSYPDVERLVKKQMQDGALIMDYCGHGVAYQISHEKVLRINDFATATSLRLPLWVTASCDIMPFDTHEDNIGETAMLNTRGGAVAFFGTTRTVYTGDNQNMNCSFMKYVLGSTDGRRNTLGDAVRLSKNDVRSISTNTGDSRSELHIVNKLHYTLLGDPALTLAAPTMEVIIDSINGKPIDNSELTVLSTGQKVRVAGHISNSEDFNGTVALTVKDAETTVTCRLNNTGGEGAQTAYTFNDRPTTVFSGQDSLHSGHFAMTFVLPQDISYSNATGLMTAYALSSDRQTAAHGSTSAFNMKSGEATENDGIGPSIYCYLNTENFMNGGNVNSTPYFFAQLTDKDGINASESGIGHYMQLTVDSDPNLTFDLNEHFTYEFGDYRSGTVGYTLPELAEGQHKLTFRAWDVLNNSTVAQLQFNVVKGLTPECFSVECTKNPARTSTTFVINHDRTGSEMSVELEVFDASGRMLWKKAETGVPTDNTYTLDWDLTTSSGSRLQTGVYLYRVLISTDGSKKASKAQKLIILKN
jgi:hypothetical protein